jgi:hypothetical protein
MTTKEDQIHRVEDLQNNLLAANPELSKISNFEYTAKSAPPPGFNGTKIFVGGTVSAIDWHTHILDGIAVPYFDSLSSTDITEITRQKDVLCNIHLYCITCEVTWINVLDMISSAYTKGKITIIQVVPDGFTPLELIEIKAVLDRLAVVGGIGYVDSDLSRAVQVVNLCFKK